MQFSIIVPTFNCAATLRRCLDSILHQDFCPSDFEMVIVDDCSTDNSPSIISDYVANHENVRSYWTLHNRGPGGARNIGLDFAKGEWILFVDSDDWLEPHALRALAYAIKNAVSENIDLLGYNWAFADNPEGRRKDGHVLSLARNSILERYLCLRMDGSVIFTAFRRALIERRSLRFADGYHEDVDFLFKAYWHAQKTAFLDNIIYRKDSRPDSIANTVSRKHIDGFVRAWQEIGSIIPEEETILRQCHIKGTVALIATRARSIYTARMGAYSKGSLYKALYAMTKDMLSKQASLVHPLDTKYNKIFNFLHQSGDLQKDDEALGITMDKFMADIISKSWSCADLRSSLFLAPGEIRACCKRFFINGIMRGDVALLNVSGGPTALDCNHILGARRNLLDRINSGEQTECTGCPYLRFERWNDSLELDIHYLSMEYHSLCNLRCSYCSADYYEGRMPQYGPKALAEDLLRSGALNNCHTVVWGGGEPCLHEDFESLLDTLVARCPTAHHRVLTNALHYSSAVERCLCSGRGSIVTSIDAGCEETYEKVRGRKGIKMAMNNLQKYAAKNPQAATIKYIFTDDNASISDVQQFCRQLEDHSLLACNVQLSVDFKKQTVSCDTLVAMTYMYGTLSRKGCEVVFFDDLFRERVPCLPEDELKQIRNRLEVLNVGEFLADPSEFEEVAVWGAGRQAELLLRTSSFLRDVGTVFVVDDTPYKQGNSFAGHTVLDPGVLVNRQTPIVIAASQGYPAIYRSLLAKGIDKSRLVKGPII